MDREPQLLGRSRPGWRQTLRTVIAVIIVVCTFRNAVADWNDVPTGSMEPSIVVGDRIVVDKLAYDLKVPFTMWQIVQWDVPQRGDVVTFISPADGPRLVKRVVGVGGDRIELRGNRLIINGQATSYELMGDEADLTVTSGGADVRFYSEDLPGRRHPIALSSGRPGRRWFGPITVPAEHVFVMGDNRDNSLDSRYFGCVALERIEGRAVAAAFSLDRRRWYCPRWGRTFKSIP